MLAGANFTTIALDTLEEHLFKRTERAISERFADQPVVRAQLLGTQAKTLASLGLPAEAIGLQEEVVRLRRAELGDRDPDTIRAMAMLGALYCDLGRVGEGEPLVRESLALNRRLRGGEDDRGTIEMLNTLGGVLLDRGDVDGAAACFSEAVERSGRVLPADDAETLRGLNNMSMLRRQEGRLEDAVALQERVVAGTVRSLGADDWGTMVAENNLASLLFQVGRLEQAEPRFREVLRVRRRMLGDDHPDTPLSINNLGVVLERMGRLEESAGPAPESFEGGAAGLGADHALTLSSLNNLGSVYRKRGMLPEAEECYRGALEGLRRALGDEHPYTLMATGNLAGVMMMRGDSAGAVGLLESAAVIASGVWTGENAPVYATMLSDLGAAQRGVGAFGEGEKNLLLAYALLAEGYGPDHPTTRSCAGKLAALYEAWEAAEPGAGHGAAGPAWREKAG
ncbi:MAG: tetratricopeptide repeat protein [Phycisphaerales bacterium]|nr:tetratricopeptide repeat protein [Phycisphaerales bacterium]